MNNQYQIYAQRRTELVSHVKKTFPQQVGPILLVGRFEHERHKFRQDSTFYYYTGVQEPGSIVLLELDGSSTLYIPAFATDRAQWLEGALKADQQTADRLGFSRLAHLGQPFKGYQASALFSQAEYEQLLAQLAQTKSFFACMPLDMHHYAEQRQVVERFMKFMQHAPEIVDISAIVARMRRKKSRHEIELMYKAIDLTMVAQQAAACSLGDGVRESAVQAGIEYIFTEAGATAAFPSIVGSGKYSTVLHYQTNNHTMRNGDLVVIDIGAEYQYYCADLTRTYPVSGQFSKRQKEIYQAVLDTQEFIATKARPGLWLSNKEKPDASLHHLALSFFEKRGYAKYFVHGIGHFLGMDVHDVGNSAEPLQPGDVITIEPGIYIAAEQLGVRIEDDYWIVEDGAECLSADLPKSIEEIESLAQSSMHDEVDEQEFSDEEDDGSYNDMQ